MPIATKAGKIVTHKGKIATHCRCCNPCPCAGTLPTQIEVTLAGIATKDPEECADCAALNGSYILVQDANNPCRYVYDFPSTVCGVNQFELIIEEVGPGVARWGLKDPNFLWASASFTTPPAPCNPSSLSLFGVVPGGVGCDGTNATFVIGEA